MAMILAFVCSAFQIDAAELVDVKPQMRMATSFDFFRKEAGELIKPVLYDDGNLPKEGPAKVKAFLDVSCPERATYER